jgi:CheY-like chemotaxis protein
MAVKEKPDLILSDVMMPKISGFDMLDILRSTPETKGIKVVMMTALSSEDQRARGESLGADRYLVKSQVGIEDVVRTIHDVMADAPIAASSAPNQAPAGPAASATPQSPKPSAPVTPVAPPAVPQPPKPVAAPVMPPVQATPAPVTLKQDITPPTPQSVATPKPPVTPVSAPTPAPVAVVPPVQPTPPKVTTIPVTQPAAPVAPAPATPVTPPPAVPAPNPSVSDLPQPTAPFSTTAPASLGEKVINPISPDITQQKDIGAMMDQELGKTNTEADPAATPPIPPTPAA